MKKAEAPADVTADSGAADAACRSSMPDGKINVQDGLRVDWPDRWFHVRVSQTEPILRVICEQKGEPPVSLV